MMIGFLGGFQERRPTLNRNLVHISSFLYQMHNDIEVLTGGLHSMKDGRPLFGVLVVDLGLLFNQTFHNFNVSLFASNHQWSLAVLRIYSINIGLCIKENIDAFYNLLFFVRTAALYSQQKGLVQFFFRDYDTLIVRR
jgi:hypothetical protein